MSKESAYLLFVQIAVSINTLVIAWGVYQVKKGNLRAHRIANTIGAGTTLAGAIGLVVTVLMGWDYSNIPTPEEMLIHRMFSVPLFPLLIAVLITGLTHKAKLHKLLAKITVPFWFGTLITGWLYF